MRIAIVVDAYKPFRSSAAIQIEDLAHEFVLQGHEVLVITPSGGQIEAWTDEFDEGVRILRLSAPLTKNIGRFRRAISEILLPIFLAINFSKSPCKSLQFDGLIWYSPTIFFGPFIQYLKKGSNCKSYLILRDIFPDIAIDLGMLKKGLIYKFFKMFEFYQYSLADTIGVQSPSNLVYLSEWSKRTRKRLEVLHNWLSIKPNLPSAFTIAPSLLMGKKIIVYAGNMGLMQGMDIVLELAQNLREKKDVAILLIGRGSEVNRLKSRSKSQGLSNIFFHDEISASDIPALLSQCYIGLLLLDPRLKTHNIPGKLISYMQAGLPILARINTGNDLKEIIVENDVGLVSVGNERDQFFLMANSLLDDSFRRTEMSRNCKLKAAELFSCEVACNQIFLALSGGLSDS